MLLRLILWSKKDTLTPGFASAVRDGQQDLYKAPMIMADTLTRRRKMSATVTRRYTVECLMGYRGPGSAADGFSSEPVYGGHCPTVDDGNAADLDRAIRKACKLSRTIYGENEECRVKYEELREGEWKTISQTIHKQQ